MALYLVRLELDGYPTEAEQKEAGLVFIEEQLDFSASSVKAEHFDVDQIKHGDADHRDWLRSKLRRFFHLD